jgi:uncharacterized membrane protein YhaH (DUF805 family)
MNFCLNAGIQPGEHRMDFETAISTCIAKSATFTGRASRSEYWKFYLFIMICVGGAYVVDVIFGTTITGEDGGFGGGLIFWLTALAFVVPLISVSVRRLHDTHRSGWWYLIQFIPFVGPLVFLICAWRHSRSAEG